MGGVRWVWYLNKACIEAEARFAPVQLQRHRSDFFFSTVSSTSRKRRKKSVLKKVMDLPRITALEHAHMKVGTVVARLLSSSVTSV